MQIDVVEFVKVLKAKEQVAAAGIFRITPERGRYMKPKFGCSHGMM